MIGRRGASLLTSKQKAGALLKKGELYRTLSTRYKSDE
jgi:hypothetical protein